MRPILPPDLKPYAFLTLEEAATLLNVKVRWMRDAVDEGRIAYYKVGRLIRIQAVDLMEFAAGCRVGPGATASSVPNSRTGPTPHSPADSRPLRDGVTRDLYVVAEPERGSA